MEPDQIIMRRIPVWPGAFLDLIDGRGVRIFENDGLDLGYGDRVMVCELDSDNDMFAGREVEGQIIRIQWLIPIVEPGEPSTAPCYLDICRKFGALVRFPLPRLRAVPDSFSRQ